MKIVGVVHEKSRRDVSQSSTEAFVGQKEISTREFPFADRMFFAHTPLFGDRVQVKLKFMFEVFISKIRPMFHFVIEIAIC